MDFAYREKPYHDGEFSPAIAGSEVDSPMTLEYCRQIVVERAPVVPARCDDAVHYERQRERQAAMRDAKSITLPTGDVTTAACLVYLRSGVLDFFDLVFDGREGLPGGKP
jgi:hypothetical protein